MKVLAVSIHPDDETLGCGGTLLRHIADGDEVSWLIVTKVHQPQWSESVQHQKADEVRRVSEAYGFRSVTWLDFPTIRLETVAQADLIQELRLAVEKHRPEIVYVVHHGDVHTDHHAGFNALLSVLKTFYMKQIGVRRVLSYETLSSTDAAPALGHRMFLPNVFHDISEFIERKIEIMNLFESEAQPDPYPRGPEAIRALARYRGACIGVASAEALMLIREVDS